MYTQKLREIPLHVVSIEQAEQRYAEQGKPIPFRRELNPMSSRWLVYDANNVCKAGGLSDNGSRSAVLYFINSQIEWELKKVA